MASAAQVGTAAVVPDYSSLADESVATDTSIAVGEQPDDAREIARPRATLTAAGSAVSPLAPSFSPAVLRGHDRATVTLAANAGSKEAEARRLLGQVQQRASGLATARTATQAQTQTLVGGVTAQAAQQRFDGDSQTEAVGIIGNLDRLQKLQTELAAKIKEMETEMQPGFVGRMRGDGYFASRVDMLRNAEIRVDRGSELYTLLGGTGRYANVSFEQMLSAMERLNGSTRESVTGLAAAPAAAEEHFKKLDARILALNASAEELGDAGTPFGLAQIGAVTVPTLQRLVAQQRAGAGRDPLGASRERTIAVTLEQAESLIRVMRDARDKLTAETPPAMRSLQQNGVQTAWVANAITGLVGAANRMAEATVQRDVRPDIVKLEAGIGQLRAALKSAVELNTERLGPATAAIAETEGAVSAARTRIGGVLKVQPQAVLAEQPYSPEASITRAREQLGTMQKALSAGDIAAASKARDASTAALRQVTELISEADRSVATHADTIAAQRRRHTELQGVIEQRGDVVVGMERTYAEPLVQSSRNDLEQSAEALNAIPARIDQAHSTYSRGGVVGASRQLQGTASDLDAVARRLDAIVASQRGLAATDASNAQAVAALESELATVQRYAADRRTRDPARQHMVTAARSLQQLRQAVAAPGRNPGELSQGIQETVAFVRQGNAAIQADWAMYAQADNAIDRVQAVLNARVMFQRNRGFLAEWALWQTQISVMRSNLSNGNYESVIQQARITEAAVVAAAIAVERAEREEQERIEAEQRARERAEAEARRRREEAEEAERQRRANPPSGTGLPSTSPGSGSGTGLPRSSGSGSGTGLPSSSGSSSGSRSGTGLPSSSSSRSGTGL